MCFVCKTIARRMFQPSGTVFMPAFNKQTKNTRPLSRAGRGARMNAEQRSPENWQSIINLARQPTNVFVGCYSLLGGQKTAFKAVCFPIYYSNDQYSTPNKHRNLA